MAERVTVLIPTLDGGAELQETLAGVLDQDLDAEVEVLVIDSGSTDGTVRFLRSQPIRLIEIPRREFNHGLTRNLGVQEAKGTLVALLTQDATPADRLWLRHLVAPFSDPRVAGSYSRQLPRPDANPFIRRRLSAWAGASSEPRVQRLASREELDTLPPLERLSRVAFDNVSSCVRRETALEIPFRRRHFGEDLDWGMRVLLAGHHIVFQPESRVIHSHDRSIWYELKRVYRDHQNLHELLEVHTVRRWSDVFRSTGAALPDLVAAVREDDRLDAWARFGWRLRCAPFAFTQNLAQFLGARSVARLAQGSVTYRFLDRLLGAGV